MDLQPPAATFIAECYWPGVREEQVEAGAVRARQVAGELTRDGQRVEFTGSVVVPGDEVVFYLFEGPSLDAVRTACERAGLPFERIVESIWNTAAATGEVAP